MLFCFMCPETDTAYDVPSAYTDKSFVKLNERLGSPIHSLRWARESSGECKMMPYTILAHEICNGDTDNQYNQ